MQSNLHQLKYTHNIMKFKQVKLSEVANLFAGYPFKGNNYSDKGVRVVRGDNVTIGHLRWTIGKDKRWNEPFDQFEYYSLHENDIVIGMDGSRIGMNRAQIKHEDLPLLLAQRVACIRNNSNSIQDYLYYQIFSNNFVRYIKAIHTGTSIPHVSLKQIGDFEIPLPSLSDQRKIAGILSALDAKIENNNKINANLESQAQALFKSWFVDFTPFKDQPFVDSELGPIPQGWKVVSLDDMTSKVGTGLNPRKNFTLGQGSNYYVTIKNMYNNRVYLDSRCDKITDEAIQKIQKRSKLQVGDLLFSGIGTIGRVALINKPPYNWNTSESVFNLHPSEEISSEFLYLLLLSNFFKNYVKINTLGGVQQGIRMASLKSFRMALPDRNVLIAFDRIIQPIVADIKRNDDENDSLAALRDTLLPKLMSGEIKL